MPTANDVIDFFRRHDGLAEDPPRSNRQWIGEWYGMNGQPWCAMTVSRALGEAGFGTVDDVRVPGVSKTTRKGWAYCPYIIRDFRNAGRWIDDKNAGQPGDLILFEWDGDGDGDHIGVVESRLGDGTYLTREGNTSSNLLQQRRRSGSTILGFCRPPYDGLGGPAVETPQPGAAPAWPGRMFRYPPVLVGDDVRTWQKRMLQRGWKRMKPDGAYGPTSRELCRAFQKEKRLGADGIVGPATWTATFTAPVT